MATQQFISRLSHVVSMASNQGDASVQFASMLMLDLSRPDASKQVASLQDALIGTSDAQITQLVESKNFFNGDWAAFSGLIISYLKLCRDIDPWSILKSHDLHLTFLNDLAVAFMNNIYGSNLSIVLYESVRYMLPLVKKVDLVLNATVNGKKFKRLIFVSSVLSKLFNHVRALKGNSQKKRLILFIANNLNKIYFIMDSPLLCQNIFANINLLDHKFSQYPKAQQVEYRYILGRFYLIKSQFTKSYIHLSWAFTHSPRSEEANIMKILRYLVPVSILVGKVPSKRVIQSYPELHHYYTPLIIHTLNGNLFSFELHLFTNQEYFKQKHILIPLAQRTRIIIFRNLIHKVYRYLGSPTRITYATLQTALMISIRSLDERQRTFGTQYLFQTLGEPIDNAFAENVCVSLVENDLMKGNVSTKVGVAVLSKNNAFPDIYGVYERKFGGMGQERWMDL